MVDILNAVDKRYIYQLMSTVQLPVSNRYESHMQIQTAIQKYDVSLAKYICASALYLMSVMYQYYSIIIDLGISAPGHGK